MREILECAVVTAPGQQAGLPPWGAPTATVRPSALRVRLQRFDLADSPVEDDADLMAAAAMRLLRFDACLLPVEPVTLPWVRMALSRAQPVLKTPVLALVREVHAAAVADLFDLGVADFLPAPLRLEELRARVLQALERRRRVPVNQALDADIDLPAALAMPGARAISGVQESAADYAMAPATGKASTPHQQDEVDGPLDSFRAAKARVVEGFERDYLCRALERHGGNVARAARASSKHRRAFWALMRKHRISADPFRHRADGYMPNGEPLALARKGQIDD